MQLDRISVSNLDYFREWRKDEESEVESLLRRIRGEEPPSPQMEAGTALHAVLENAKEGEFDYLESDRYRFYFSSDISIYLPPIREMRISKQYAGLEVRGRVDGVLGHNTVLDYKSTGQFDPERLLSGFQWRFYLDMLGMEHFAWKVLVIRETETPFHFDVIDAHDLTQHRYEGIERECAALAEDFSAFIQQFPELVIELPKAELPNLDAWIKGAAHA